MPRLYKPSEEVELRRKVCVAGRDHVDRARGLRDLDSGLDLVESAWITEAATRTADDDVQTGALVFHPQLLDQRQRLGTDLNRFFESSGQHLVAAVLRERLRTRAGCGAIGDRFEGAADVVVGRSTVAGEPRATGGNGCRFRLSFDVSRHVEPLHRFRQKVEHSPAEREERTGALEQQAWTSRVIWRRERERVGEEVCGGGICRQRERSFSCGSQRLARTLDQRRVVGDSGRACKLERLAVVVRKQLGMVLRTPQTLEPLGRSAVLLRTCAARNLTVRDVTEQHVLERVLRIGGDG